MYYKSILLQIFIKPLWQNLSDIATLSQKRNYPLQKDLSIKFRNGFKFQNKAGCGASYSKFYCILIVLLVFLSLNVYIMHN